MVKNLVFSGGAFKGWAFIGTLRALEEYIEYSDIENVAGTSIGSVFGLFYILKIPWKYLLDAIMNTKFKNILDIVDINVLLSSHYLIKGLMFKEYITGILKKHNINPELTFKDLSKLSNIKLTTTALNINKYSIEYFNIDNTPNIKVIDAVIASCSIPLLFPICVIDGYSIYQNECATSRCSTQKNTLEFTQTISISTNN
jgi:predicted acylesterase/phospholipase RssA